MLLNVLKGAYPSLQQISKDHLIDTAEKFERGICLVEQFADGVTTWKVADGTTAEDPAAIVHFSLHGADDYQTLQAGTMVGEKFSARVSALSCLQPMEIETDMFDKEADLEPGDYLTTGAGGILVKAANDGSQNIYAQVTKAKYARWSNNAESGGVPSGFRQGATVDVIAARTVFIPATA